MREELYHQLAEVEDRLWWHDARRELVRHYLRKFRFQPEAAALDVGCGTGGSFDLLAEFAATIVGVDCSQTALDLARTKHPSAILRNGDATELSREFAPDTFDLVTLFNVLYHSWIPDDSAVLQQVQSILKPGGVLLLTDAAFPSLFRRHDRAAMGARRYRVSSIRRLLIHAGLDWQAGTYFNAGSVVPAWIAARCDAWSTREVAAEPIPELRLPPPWINATLKACMAMERGFIRLIGHMPIGVSLLAVARKPTATPPVDRETGQSCLTHAHHSGVTSPG